MKSITGTFSILKFGVGRNGHSTPIPLSSLNKDAVVCFLKCSISQGHEWTVTLANWVNMAEASWWKRLGWLWNLKVFHRKGCGRQSINLRVSYDNLSAAIHLKPRKFVLKMVRWS